MKKVISGKELQEKMLESIHLLCGTVKQTLGPKGNNVIIDHSSFSPFITNDGVTIAKNIESEDECIACILELAKEASIKTDEEAGDGTTTTLVLLESIYEQSIEVIKDGISPIILKKELDKVLKIIINKLQILKRKATLEDLKRIATISANDEELGKLAFKAFQKVKNKEAITIKEITENSTYVTYLKGYICETTLASPHFLRDTNKLNYKDAYVLLMNTPLTSLESISFLLNEILRNKKDLVIIASDFDEQIIEEILSLYLTEDIHVCMLKIEEYGLHVHKIMKDIESITNAKRVENENQITSENIGIAKNIEITQDIIRIDFKMNEQIKKYLSTLKKERKEITGDIEIDFYEKRIAMFSNGTAEIKLGAPTKTERLEKRMRLQDALCALSVSDKGILTGGGVSLLQIVNDLQVTNEATKIWKQALQKPFEQIMNNAGIDSQNIKDKIEKEKYQVIFNVSNDAWEERLKTKVIDPFLVVQHSLVSASSIAGMLLTTTSLIINEYKNSLNKESDYSEM